MVCESELTFFCISFVSCFRDKAPFQDLVTVQHSVLNRDLFINLIGFLSYRKYVFVLNVVIQQIVIKNFSNQIIILHFLNTLEPDPIFYFAFPHTSAINFVNLLLLYTVFCLVVCQL